MAAGTLLVLDASLPGGLIEGSGDMRYAQTMAFTTLMMFQFFNVFNARSDETSAFRWALFQPMAVGRDRIVTRAASRGDLHTVSAASIFDHEPRRADWALCAVAASSVLWLRELSKLITKAPRRNAQLASAVN